MVDRNQGVPYWRLSALYFMYFAAVGVMSPYWPVYLEALGFSGAEIGLIIAIPMGTRLLAPNLWGWLADRTGLYLRVIQLGAALAFLVFSGLFLFHSFWGVVAFTLVFTFFWNAILPQFEVITLDHLKDQTHFYSRIRLWGSIGFIVSVVGLGIAFDYFAKSILLWVMWFTLLCILLTSLILPSSDHSAQIKVHSGRFLQLLKQPKIINFLSANLFLHLSHGAFYGFFSLYLLNHGYSSSMVGLLWAVGVVAEIILFLKVPWIFKRFSLYLCFCISVAFAALRWMVVAEFVDFLWAMVVAQIFHAFTFGLAHSTSIEFMRSQFPSQERGKAQALYSAVCFGGGSAAGAYLSGLAWSYSTSFCYWLAAAFAIGGLIIALAGRKFYYTSNELPL